MTRANTTYAGAGRNRREGDMFPTLFVRVGQEAAHAEPLRKNKYITNTISVCKHINITLCKQPRTLAGITMTTRKMEAPRQTQQKDTPSQWQPHRHTHRSWRFSRAGTNLCCRADLPRRFLCRSCSSSSLQLLDAGSDAG